MLLLYLILISTDAGPDVCTLHPDLCILWLWCFPSLTGAIIPLAQVVVSPVATCAGGAFSFSHQRCRKMFGVGGANFAALER